MNDLARRRTLQKINELLDSPDFVFRFEHQAHDGKDRIIRIRWGLAVDVQHFDGGQFGVRIRAKADGAGRFLHNVEIFLGRGRGF